MEDYWAVEERKSFSISIKTQNNLINHMHLGQFLLYSLAPGFTLNFITIIDGPVYGVLMSLTDWLNGLISPGASSAQFTTLSSFPPL